jgi:hypothetical protein
MSRMARMSRGALQGLSVGNETDSLEFAMRGRGLGGGGAEEVASLILRCQRMPWRQGASRQGGVRRPTLAVNSSQSLPSLTRMRCGN